MIRRFASFLPIFTILAFGACALPLHALAATASDGTLCIPMTGADGKPDCIDASGVSHGAPASTTPIDANDAKILGCATTNTNIPSVGQLTATGGPYVPVTDAAVTKNTGYLVYKECVLDQLAAKLKDAAATQIIQEGTKLIVGTDTIPPKFVQNVAENRAEIQASSSNNFFADVGSYQETNPDAISSDVVDAVKQEVGDPTPSYAATMNASDQNAFIHSQNTGGWSDWFNYMANSNNNSLFQKLNLQTAYNNKVAIDTADNAQVLNWGHGYLSTMTNGQITTPGDWISREMEAITDLGRKVLASSNSLDSIPPGSVSGIGPQALSNPNGLTSLTAPTANTDGTTAGPSYVDQMFQSIINLIKTGTTDGSGGSLDTTTTPSSATTALTAAIATEQQYLNYRQQTKTAVAAEGQKLTDAQDACWISLETAVAALATSTNAQYTVATSTAYAASSTADIITPVQNLLSADINQSTSTIATLQTLLVGLTAVDNDTTEQAALASLATLKATHTLHDSDDLTVAAEGITDMPATVGTKVDATIATWKQGTGWCNASSTAVVAAQLAVWEK